MERTTLRTILYVDDEPDIRQIVQMALGLAEGLTVHTGESGEQALELARQLQPDLLLLDVMMPGLDGPGTLLRMRDDPQLMHIPVIFMTAKAMPREVARFRQMGAVGVIAKPFDPMQLSSQVLGLWEAYLQGRRLMDKPHEEARLRGQLTQLREKFLQRTRGELVLLRDLIDRVPEGDATVLAQLESAAHKIHGSGATFGFTALSECAGEIEHLIEGLIVRDTSAGAAIEPQVLRHLMECSQRLAQETEGAVTR